MKKLILLSVLLSVLTFGLAAQDDGITDDYAGVTSYSTGEQIFSLNAGAIFPLFTISPNPEDGAEVLNFLTTTNIGVSGSLKWGTFVLDNFYLGIDLTGMFATTSNRTLSMIPISFTTGYYFIVWPFEIPVYLNTGFSFNTLGDYFTITPSIRPGFGVYYNVTDDWAVGLNADYWFMPEIYFSGEFVNQSMIANFAQVSISAVFHF